MNKDKLFLEELDDIQIEEAKKLKHRRKKKPFNSMTITTGDIGLNIDRFNTAMGTNAEHSATNADTTEASVDGCALCEAKRYVRRYYIRPQNIFASNKAEIIKTLIDIGKANCTVYTLNNLGDEKDVSKLMNSDIIYYYDDGILYDKNHVQVMDYDLSIKHEEERKKFTKVDDNSKEFKTEYEDRMTSATNLEENLIIDAFNNCDYDVISADYLTRGDGIVVNLNHNVPDEEAAAEHLISCLADAGYNIIDWNTNGSNVFIFALDPQNPLDLDFEDINAYGESLNEAKETFCCICGEPIEGYGNNPEPFMNIENGVCCQSCNLKFVIPARIEQWKEG